jgi:hypothetical protein
VHHHIGAPCILTMCGLVLGQRFMSISSNFYNGDTSEVRREIADRVLKLGSLTNVAKDAHCSVSYLCGIMSCRLQPGTRLLSYLDFDRTLTVHYFRR